MPDVPARAPGVRGPQAMRVAVVRWSLGVVGAVAGYRVAALVVASGLGEPVGLIPGAIAGKVAPLAIALLGLLGGMGSTRAVTGAFQRLLGHLHGVPLHELAAGALGMAAGLLLAILATWPIPRDLPLVGDLLPVLVTLAAGYVGMSLGVRKRDEVAGLWRWRARDRGGSANPGAPASSGAGVPVVVDTSAIIDGRIRDICRTGFLDGPLVVPGFVVRELQHIADASDPVRRNRGRRGLDMLNWLQKEPSVRLQLMEPAEAARGDVDLELIRLARELRAKVITCDFNLNKVAALHGVPVLNVNDLANALKPVVLPGEEMTVQLIRDGKEQGQGVGYLDDGTMIVVDGGRRFIGESVDVTVTSVLQTSAGRLIFARPKTAERAVHA